MDLIVIDQYSDRRENILLNLNIYPLEGHAPARVYMES